MRGEEERGEEERGEEEGEERRREEDRGRVEELWDVARAHGTEATTQWFFQGNYDTQITYSILREERRREERKRREERGEGRWREEQRRRCSEDPWH